MVTRENFDFQKTCECGYLFKNTITVAIDYNLNITLQIMILQFFDY